MSLRVKLVLLFALLPLAACGFRPLYGKQEQRDNAPLFAGIRVETIKGRLGQEFRAELEDELNPQGMPASPQYRLDASISTTESPIGVARDATVSRYNVYINSHYTLTRVSDNKQVTTGDVSTVSSYNNLTNLYYSTYISQQDATRNGMKELAQLYRQRLSAYLSSQTDIKPDAMRAEPAIPPNPYPNATILKTPDGKP